MRLTPEEKIIYNLTTMKILNLMNLLIADSQLTLARAALVGHWCQLQISSQQTFIQQTSSSFNSDLTNTKFSWKKYFSAGLKVIKFNFRLKISK